jgi:hypothetical protein
LKQLALAMHNYHDTHGRLPPAVVYGEDGKALLSWRVLLLPFIEEDNLFRQFRAGDMKAPPGRKRQGFTYLL